jgi:hypothetical protein
MSAFNISTHISGVKPLSAAGEILSGEIMVSALANLLGVTNFLCQSRGSRGKSMRLPRGIAMA